MEASAIIIKVVDQLLSRPVAAARVSDVALQFFPLLAQMLETNLSERVTLQLLGTVKNFIHKVCLAAGVASLAFPRRALRACTGNGRETPVLRVRSRSCQFAEPIVKENNVLCSDLCRVLLPYACAALPAPRQHSTALLYLMIRKNWETSKRIAKVGPHRDGRLDCTCGEPHPHACPGRVCKCGCPWDAGYH